jgi:hypothetical protein
MNDYAINRIGCPASARSWRREAHAAKAFGTALNGKALKSICNGSPVPSLAPPLGPPSSTAPRSRPRWNSPANCSTTTATRTATGRPASRARRSVPGCSPPRWPCSPSPCWPPPRGRAAGGADGRGPQPRAFFLWTAGRRRRTDPHEAVHDPVPARPIRCQARLCRSNSSAIERRRVAHAAGLNRPGKRPAVVKDTSWLCNQIRLSVSATGKRAQPPPTDWPGTVRSSKLVTHDRPSRLFRRRSSRPSVRPLCPEMGRCPALSLPSLRVLAHRPLRIRVLRLPETVHGDRSRWSRAGHLLCPAATPVRPARWLDLARGATG